MRGLARHAGVGSRFLGGQCAAFPLHIARATKSSASENLRSGAGTKSEEPTGSKHEDEPEVPQVGWLWQPTKNTPEGKTPALVSVANLKKDRIKAKKSLGQNYLTDENILRNIAVTSGVRKGDLVLEVGPGTGNLTRHLLHCGARVTAVEKDDVLFPRLAEEYEKEGLLTIVHGDILRLDLPGLLDSMVRAQRALREGLKQEAAAAGADEAVVAAEEQQVAEEEARDEVGVPRAARQSRAERMDKIKVVANLPYNITKDFLKRMLPMGDRVSELNIMIQDEAAVRLIDSKPGSNDYRAMNLFVQFYSVPKYRFCISRFKYDPVPGVNGALVTFKLLPPDKRKKLPGGTAGERSFLRTVSSGFNERRKKLRNSLSPAYTPLEVENALEAAGLKKSARAQELDLDQHIALAFALNAQVMQQGSTGEEQSGQQPLAAGGEDDVLSNI